MKSKKGQEKGKASKPTSTVLNRVEPLKQFKKDLKPLLKKYRSLIKDLEDFETSILENPKQGVSLGNNCYKVRLDITSKTKGKSGGARIITYLYYKGETIYLLTIYDKKDMDNVSDQYIQSLIDSIKSEFE